MFLSEHAVAPARHISNSYSAGTLRPYVSSAITDDVKVGKSSQEATLIHIAVIVPQLRTACTPMFPSVKMQAGVAPRAPWNRPGVRSSKIH